jgi:hypothetical protein
MLLALLVLVILMFVPRRVYQSKLGFDPIPWLAGAGVLVAAIMGAWIGAGLLAIGGVYYVHRKHQHAALSGPETPPELGGGDDSPTGS